MSGNVPHSYPTRRLPKRPNLEQLRKQAKDLLEQYRAGVPEAVAEVEKFELHPNPASFALHDAQRVLARAYGYASWAKLKAFVDGVNVVRLAAAVQAGDIDLVRRLLAARPELVGMDMSGGDEHRALHYAVLRRDAAMVKLLMEAGADARKGIYPHREATSALALAKGREYQEIVAAIEHEEQARRTRLSCPNSSISPLQDEITRAIRQGDIAAAIALLERDPSLIHACDREGGTPLHIAAERTNDEMVAWLLERRAGVNKQDIRGLTPLDRAALSAHPQNECARHFPRIAQRMLERGATLSIHAAVALADEQRIRQLIAEDPSLLRKIESRGGLLSLAVNHDHLEIVRLLLDLGADVDERYLLTELEEPTTSWGMPLWYAAMAGQYKIAELLLDRGADPNANVYASGWPLHNAWQYGHKSVARLLRERGAEPTPYMAAAMQDVAGAARLLESGTSEETARELAWSAADSGCPAIVKLAIPRLDWPLDDSRWHWVIIQPIRGVDSDRPDHEGYFECMEILLRRGIDPNLASYGQTLLHYTAGWHGSVSDSERARFAAMLLDHGARLDVRDDLLRSTPLAWACRWGRVEMVELLIARGAPVEEPAAEPWATPKAWAEKMGQKAVLEVLRRHGA